MKYLLVIFTFAFLSCGQNETKQKELELKERELALKEKEFALKQSDSPTNKTTVTTLVVPPTTEPKKDTTQKSSVDKKFIKCSFKYMTCGDGCNYHFTDNITKKEFFYSDGDNSDFYANSKDKWLAAIEEIKELCNNYPAGCSLKGQQYLITLGHKLVEIYDYDTEKTSKKMSWVIIALNKI